MKIRVSSVLLSAMIPWVGCASHGLVLAPVGPPTHQRVAASTGSPSGSLVVFSALDPSPHFNALPYRTFYSDYRVFSESGALLQRVHNDNGTSLDGPKTVTLPPGNYRVVANANGYGVVTVPVVIVDHETTTVHLEGGSSWPGTTPIAQANPVRLPDGQVVGWRAPVAGTSSVKGPEVQTRTVQAKKTAALARNGKPQASSAPVKYHYEIITAPPEEGTQWLQLVPDTQP